MPQAEDPPDRGSRLDTYLSICTVEKCQLCTFYQLFKLYYRRPFQQVMQTISISMPIMLYRLA